ncbi:MAG: cell wall-binding repeat-containing protein, partial [Acidobacteriota bacterium]|nr:cell wall-binding repeat-containing protein [Acidobacteriota bacterium]
PAIYAIGPPAAIPDALVARLEQYGTVHRISGNTPAENAIAVARFSEGSFGFGVQGPGHGLAFANAQRPLDGAAAAALATGGDFAPLLLLESASSLPAPLTHYLEDIAGAYNKQVPAVKSLYNHGWIIGGADAVTPVAQAQIDALLEIVSRNTPTPTPEFAP